MSGGRALSVTARRWAKENARVSPPPRAAGLSGEKKWRVSPLQAMPGLPGIAARCGRGAGGEGDTLQCKAVPWCWQLNVRHFTLKRSTLAPTPLPHGRGDPALDSKTDFPRTTLREKSGLPDFVRVLQSPGKPGICRGGGNVRALSFPDSLSPAASDQLSTGIPTAADCCASRRATGIAGTPPGPSVRPARHSDATGPPPLAALHKWRRPGSVEERRRPDAVVPDPALTPVDAGPHGLPLLPTK
ncbi:hypothetical protein SAMN02799631_00256 [Methylobacterium sp. 174MFSha1.1]|nr:hypothetical protein SAMN02799631_00256 [Methylobacterium sp. 174MFSha1.1]